jgi:hypothetical protein
MRRERSLVRRAALIALGGLCLAIFAGTAPAGAAVTIGQTFTPDDNFGGSGAFIQTGTPDNSYVVPSDGVVTSWSFQGPPQATPPMKLKMFRAAGGDDYTTVGDSALVTPASDVLNTFQTRIPVKAGDVPGHFYSDTTFSYTDVDGYDTHEISDDPGSPNLDIPPGTTFTYEATTGNHIDLSAVIEPDADHDGFGDETQDACPTIPTADGACPVKKKKCKHRKKHKKHRSAESAKKKKCKKKKHH